MPVIFRSQMLSAKFAEKEGRLLYLDIWR